LEALIGVNMRIGVFVKRLPANVIVQPFVPLAATVTPDMGVCSVQLGRTAPTT
jgi:hypothetical protein